MVFHHYKHVRSKRLDCDVSLLDVHAWPDSATISQQLLSLLAILEPRETPKNQVSDLSSSQKHPGCVRSTCHSVTPVIMKLRRIILVRLSQRLLHHPPLLHHRNHCHRRHHPRRPRRHKKGSAGPTDIHQVWLYYSAFCFIT